MLVVRVHGYVVTVNESGFGVPQLQKRLVEIKQAVGIGGFSGNVDGACAWRHRKPRRDIWRGEACVRRRRCPLHRSPFSIVALLLRPPRNSDRVTNIFLANGFGGPHADLLAVIHLWGSTGHQLEHRHELRNLFIVNAVAVTLPLTHLIVIAEEILGPAVCGIGFHLAEKFAELGRGKLIRISNLKVHGQLHFVVMRAIHLA